MLSLVNNAQKAIDGVKSPPTSLKSVGRHPSPPLPQPPPLPVDLTKLERVPNNQGIGKSSTKNQSRRGPTKMNHIITRRLEDRPIICLNSEFQTYSKKYKVVNELSSFLGMIARDRIKSKPAKIPLEQFMVILKYWSDEAVQDKAEKNVANRKKVTDTHTVGRISFAQLRSKMLLGRGGIIRKSNKKLAKTGHTDSADVEKMREEIASEMDDKLNKKLKKILGRLAEMNPATNVNVDELCVKSWIEADGSDDDEKDRDADDGDANGGGDESDEDSVEVDSDGGDESA
ncbi:hypothetical protein AgCh_035914 [Apium graveolens]